MLKNKKDLERDKNALEYIEARALSMGMRNINEWVKHWYQEYKKLNVKGKELFWELYDRTFQIDNILLEVKLHNIQV